MAEPRDYLAAERTFLAWLRTGLALMGFGFVVARFGLFLQQLAFLDRTRSLPSSGVSLWIGTILIAAGILVSRALGVEACAYCSPDGCQPDAETKFFGVCYRHRHFSRAHGPRHGRLPAHRALARPHPLTNRSLLFRAACKCTGQGRARNRRVDRLKSPRISCGHRIPGIADGVRNTRTSVLTPLLPLPPRNFC